MEVENPDDFKNISIYNPLERPTNFVTDNGIQDYYSSSDTDSDASSSEFSKKIKNLKRSREPVKNEKLKIWQKCADEDFVIDFNSCSIKKSRHVETYNYKIKKSPMKDDTKTGQSIIKAESNVNIRKPRYLPMLRFTEADDNNSFTDALCECLRERNKLLIKKIVESIGQKDAFGIYKQTKAVEANGGLFTSDGYRRRTSGGVFILLAKEGFDFSGEKKTIFYNNNFKTKKTRREKCKRNKKRKNKNRNFSTSECTPATAATGDIDVVDKALLLVSPAELGAVEINNIEDGKSTLTMQTDAEIFAETDFQNQVSAAASI